MDTQAPTVAWLSTMTAPDLAELEHVARKRTGSDHLGRCYAHGGYIWRGGARRPACPVCGGELSNTTSNLSSGFYVLDGILLDSAERLPGGIRAAIAWHESQRVYYFNRAGQALEGALDVQTATEPDFQRQWQIGDRIAQPSSNYAGRENVDGLIRRADAERAKARKQARRLEKLGLPLTIVR